MKEIFIVGAGGGIGAISRYCISKIMSNVFNLSIPIGTLTENVLGGFLIGFIFQLSISTNSISSNLKLFLTTGLLGGLTTFSTFSYETVTLFSEGKYILGMLNIVLNVSLSLIGVALSMFICKAVV